MKCYNLALAAIVLSVAAAAVAQQENKLNTFQQVYEKQQQALLSQYSNGLDSAINDLKKKGDLDNILVIQAELDRLNRDKSAPEPAAVKEAFRAPAQAHYQAATTLMGQYVKALDGLIKQQVGASQIEEAKLCKAEKDKISFAMADLQTRVDERFAARKPDKPKEATPETAPAAATAKDTKPEKPAREEEATALVFVDDQCDLFHNGEKIPFSQGTELKLTIREGDIIAAKCSDMQGGAGCGFAIGIKLVSNGKIFCSDNTWVYSRDEENGWQEKGFDDRKWKKCVRSDLECLIKVISTGFDRWKTKPRPIWGKGSPVYLRKKITFSEFR